MIEKIHVNTLLNFDVTIFGGGYPTFRELTTFGIYEQPQLFFYISIYYLWVVTSFRGSLIYFQKFMVVMVIMYIEDTNRINPVKTCTCMYSVCTHQMLIYSLHSLAVHCC